MLHSRTQVKSSYFTPKPLLLPTQLHDLTCCITPQTKRKNKENRSVPTAAVEEPKGVHDANAVTGPWTSWPHHTCTATGGARTALARMVTGMVARF